MVCVLNAVITTKITKTIKSTNKLLWKSLFWDAFLKKHVVSHINLKTGTYLSNIPRTRERQGDFVVERMAVKPRTTGITFRTVHTAAHWWKTLVSRVVRKRSQSIVFCPWSGMCCLHSMWEAGRTCPVIVMSRNVQEWCGPALFQGI